MSMENLKEFIKRIKEDAALAAEVKKSRHDVDGLISCANQLGLEITQEDFEELRSAYIEENKELADEELGNVSGGWSWEIIQDPPRWPE